jgi:hypothetical protein
VLPHKPKVVYHVVGGVIESAGDGRAYRFDLLSTAKLNPGLDLDHPDPVQPGQEIEMPKGTAILAIRCRLQADVFLHPDDLLDATVFDVV